MLKNKRGLTASFIIGMMITLVAFVLISGVLLRFTSKASDKEAEVLCQNSIALRAKSALSVKHELLSAEIKLVPPLCQTIDQKIKGNRQQILRQVAESTARCWWMFGEGRYEELLDPSNLEVLPSIMGFNDYKNHCFNCYTLLIDQDEIEDGPIESDEINEFFRTKKYSKVNITYLDYIQKYGGPGRAVFTAPVILPRQAYTVSMLPKSKEVGEGEMWKGVGQGVAAVAIGAVVVVGVVGGVACIIGSGGICAGPLAAAAAGASTGTVVAAGAVTTVGALGATGTALAAVTATYFGNAAYMNVMSSIYRERDVSTVSVGFLEVGQQMCGSGDLAGE